jgi:microcystin-dependent protein
MEPFIAQIMMFGGNFAPRGWALCDGQLLAISSNSALFSLLGTTYGGDGRTTFGLPDLRGRVPIHPGTGPGLSPYTLGQKGGVESVTLTENQLPSHRHTLWVDNDLPSPQGTPPTSMSGMTLAREAYVNSNAPDTQLNAEMMGYTGGSQSVGNLQPFLTVNFIIALQGIYPSRS